VKTVETGEEEIKALGFRQFRVRFHGEVVRIEIARDEMERALTMEMAQRFTAIFKGLGFKYVSLDLEGYRQGSLNEVLNLRYSGGKSRWFHLRRGLRDRQFRPAGAGGGQFQRLRRVGQRGERLHLHGEIRSSPRQWGRYLRRTRRRVEKPDTGGLVSRDNGVRRSYRFDPLCLYYQSHRRYRHLHRYAHGVESVAGGRRGTDPTYAVWPRTQQHVGL
jgi:hypothetical protein